MKTLIILLTVSLVFLFSACSKKIQTVFIDGTEGVLVPWGQQENKIIEFESSYKSNFRGFKKYELNLSDARNITIPALNAAEQKFYKKNAGIYVDKATLENGYLPLSNLVKTDTSWGIDYFLRVDMKTIDYSEKLNKFYWNDMTSGATIDDISRYKIKSNWYKISGPSKYLGVIRETLSQRNKYINYFRETKYSETELYNAGLDALKAIIFLRENETEELTSKQFGFAIEQAKKNIIPKNKIKLAIRKIKEAYRTGNFNGAESSHRLFSLFGSDVNARIRNCEYNIYINQYINYDYSRLNKYYNEIQVLEYVFVGTQEYFLLGFIFEEEKLKICFIKNGMCDA